ncbi:uncharacterized protein B0J16DRAFT_315275 [Fusarium flagelliforme]|uniref:uncharacterized protein n=1 Tax=Fusarium flagelliforme TaxID=2675880 RepID=UPI001E8E4079|nr:uncharacterized protein B0J16DRAFT_315275 [Fusarium flagelliforme]KAH7198986.1 hypothetical protein B0J16DRAFT_315275 [Fusarium flagelliforme]
MKTFILYASLTFMGMVNAQKACVDGEKVNVSPGYTVQYQCNKYRDGTRYDNVMSHNECAVHCEPNGYDVCTYHEGRKMCIVGYPYGKEANYNGYTYMMKVKEEDPFPEDPFPKTCEEQRDEYKTKLDQCRADVKKRSEEKEKRAEEEERKRVKEEEKKRTTEEKNNSFLKDFTAELIKAKAEGVIKNEYF